MIIGIGIEYKKMREKIYRQEQEPPEYFKIMKRNVQIPDYMTSCINGAAHPMKIEYEDYQIVGVGTMRLDLEGNKFSSAHSEENLTELEEVAIQDFKDQPEIEWAMHNSFDGLYIRKIIDYHEFRVMFNFAVYMKSSNKTFWLLKYGEKILS